MSEREPQVQEPPGDKRDPQSKVQHIEACLTPDVEYRKTTGLERYDFVNQALPEVSLEDIDLGCQLAGKELRAPLMISPMTGGVERGGEINRRLARCAERHGLPMGVGSQRVGVEDAARAQHFKVREEAPTTLLFANIGAVQLVKGWGQDEAMRAVEMIDADALFLHLNPIQEAIQGGDQDFRGLTSRITEVVRALSRAGVPVFAREVGFGLSEEAARALIDCGVAGLDCAGAGGTSWAKVEGIVAKSERRRIMGEVFGDWGIPTAESILHVRRVSERIPLIATGGLRSGVDVAKALALGADIGSMARPFLVAADAGDDALDAFVDRTLIELRICMFGIGAGDLDALKGTRHLVRRA
jgi:isopentenyl-diphosphate Delta-isomerase